MCVCVHVCVCTRASICTPEAKHHTLASRLFWIMSMMAAAEDIHQHDITIPSSVTDKREPHHSHRCRVTQTTRGRANCLHHYLQSSGRDTRGSCGPSSHSSSVESGTCRCGRSPAEGTNTPSPITGINRIQSIKSVNKLINQHAVGTLSSCRNSGARTGCTSGGKYRSAFASAN